MENEELILSKLDILKQEIDFIKKHIVDVTLNQDDIDSICKAEEDLKEGRTKRL